MHTLDGLIKDVLAYFLILNAHYNQFNLLYYIMHFVKGYRVCKSLMFK